MILLYTFLLQTADGNSLSSARIILALLCVIVLSSTGFAVLIGLTRRIHAIADQTPQSKPSDEEEADPGDHIDRE